MGLNQECQPALAGRGERQPAPVTGAFGRDPGHVRGHPDGSSAAMERLRVQPEEDRWLRGTAWYDNSGILEYLYVESKSMVYLLRRSDIVVLV